MVKGVKVRKRESLYKDVDSLRFWDAATGVQDRGLMGNGVLGV